MEKHITDASVKAGLQLEGDTNPLKQQQAVPPGEQGSASGQKKNNTDTSYKDAAKETDADDLVHEKENDIDTGNKAQDPDELVHSSNTFKTVRENDEVDPDELVHESNEDPFEE